MRTSLTTLLAAALLVALSSGTARAQIIQLPTFHQFSVGTTVVVPDRGSAYLGGVKRSRSSAVSAGIPGVSHLPGLGRLTRSRGIGRESSASHAVATVRIHDFEAMDRELLGERKFGAVDPKIAAKAAFIGRHIGRRNAASRNAGAVPRSRFK